MAYRTTAPLAKTAGAVLPEGAAEPPDNMAATTAAWAAVGDLVARQGQRGA